MCRLTVVAREELSVLRFKVCSVAALFTLFVIAMPLAAKAGPTLVFDVESGTVLHSEDPGASWYPASLTKLMTAYLTFHAIRDGRLSLDSTLTMSENAQAEPPSKVGLPIGSEFSIDWALQVLLVRSANDLAVSIAEGVGGTEAAFVELMNTTARRLAMTGTYFSNPHGLPDRRQMTTARDLGLLARAIIREFPEHQNFFEAQTVRIGGRNLSNRNSLLRSMSDADGMKTGFICNSGYNLVSSATRNGRRLVAIVLGAANGGQRATTAQALLEEGFAAQTGGDLFSLPRKLVELSNGGLFHTAPPVDMAPTVCASQGTVRLTEARAIRGWSVVFGSTDGATDAQTLLDTTLEPLRDVFYGGRAVVTRAPDTRQYTAMVHNLEAAQTTAICSTLRTSGADCEVLPPEAYQDIIASLEEEEAREAEARRQRQREQQAAEAEANQSSNSSSGSQQQQPAAEQSQGSSSGSGNTIQTPPIEDLR